MGQTQLFLLRHGETAWNREGRWQGQTDLELNELGREQARGAAAKIASSAPEFAYCSDLRRAVQTAELATQGLNLKLHAHSGLRESHFGRWEGLSVPEILRDHAATWEARLANVVDIAPPGGESLRALANRMTAALSEIAAAHAGRRVLVVSHGFAIAAALATRLGHALEEAQRLIPKNCEVIEIPWPSPS